MSLVIQILGKGMDGNNNCGNTLIKLRKKIKNNFYLLFTTPGGMVVAAIFFSWKGRHTCRADWVDNIELSPEILRQLDESR